MSRTARPTDGSAASRIDDVFVTTTLQDLVRIDSVNPHLSAHGRGESEIAAYTERTLRRMGLEVHVHEAAPSRPSVVGILRGSGEGASIMLNGHLDTVGIEGMANPLSGDIREGKLFGRGAYDMKGGVAACIGAVKALADAPDPPPGDVLVALVADEEYASIGASDLMTRYRPDAAIVTEPTALQICVAHKGFVWIEVETVGRAYHGSQFTLGIDANMRMGRFLHALEALEQNLRQRTPHPHVGPPSLHAAMMSGGSALSIYAAAATLQIERRTVPGESLDQVFAEITDIIARLAGEDDSFKATARVLLSRDAFEVPVDAPIVRALAGAVTDALGITPRLVGENPWMDSAIFASSGVETVVIGPEGAGAHSEQEWVDLQSVLSLSRILASTASRYGASRPGRPISRDVHGTAPGTAPASLSYTA